MHNLHIETGRYAKTPRSARYCVFCKSSQQYVVEDEEVFLSNRLVDGNCKKFILKPRKNDWTFVQVTHWTLLICSECIDIKKILVVAK